MERPENIDIYVVEADRHVWPPMLAAAQAHAALGSDPDAAREIGEVVVSCVDVIDARRRVSVAGQLHTIGEQRYETRRRSVKYRGDLMLLVGDIEAAVREIQK